MKHCAARLAAAVLLAVACGCRETDYREFTMDIPGMDEKNIDAIRAAVLEAGAFPDSLKWDYAKKTLTLRFDSMRTAQANFRSAVEAKGVEVKFPDLRGKPAGYINEREPEVK